VAAIAALVGATACNSNSVSPGDDELSGSWTFVIDVTTATGVCAGEELAPVDVSIATIAHSGASVSITGPWGSTSGSETLNGNLTGDVVSVGGSYAEDGGTTTATHTLTVSSDRNSMSGTEAWSWIGPGGSCPGSAPTVTATRN
jgi:hypothetical protein